MTGHTEAAIVWSQAKERFPPTKGVDLDKEVAHVLRYLEAEAPDLYSGLPAPRWTEEDVIQLARGMSSKAPESRVRIWFRFLALGFEIGNKDYGWSVPLVPYLVRVRKARNWATIDNFTRRVVTGRLERAFGESLESSPAKNLAGNLGQVLFTAVFFGGLLERVWLEPFLNAVVRRQFFQHKGIVWVEMTKENKLPADQLADPGDAFYTKRFFPDNFTAVLLYRMLDLGVVPSAIPCPKPWDLLKSYLKTLPGISDLPLPGSLDEFLKLAVSRNLLLPGSILSYATGKLRSTSLAIEPWLRCISGKAVCNSRPVNLPDRKGKGDGLKLAVPRKYSAKRQEALFGKLQKDISPKNGVELSGPETKAVLGQLLDEHKKEMSPAFQLLIHWGRQLLSPRLSRLERRSNSGAVTTRTVRRYFGALGSSFLLEAENRNLATIDQIELELLYEQVLEDRRSDNKAAQCLCQFHGFLMAFFDCPPIESVELKGAAAGATNRNANLITLDVYRLVLRGLGWGRVGMSRWQRMRVIAWIICYRCGLRPAEVLNLRVIDFQMTGSDDFELVVRVSPKTERGRRRIPASQFIKGDERLLLLEYFQQRCQDKGLFGENYLLAHPEQRTGRLTDEVIYEPTRSLLRSITGDDTLRLYHARHTFNSALQAQFQMRGKPLFEQVGYLDLDVTTDNDRLLRVALMGNEHMGRKDQHVQGIVVGHSSPETTNKYYNHLTDVLLGTLVRQRRDMVPVSLVAVAVLGELQQSWAGELLVKSGSGHPLTGLVKVMAGKHASQLAHPLLTPAVPLSLSSEETREKVKLKPWEGVLTRDVARELSRGEGNWDIACQIYERVRQTKGKRFRTVASIIQEMGRQMENSSRRWRGPVYAGITELRSALATVQEIGVLGETVVLVHHPRRGQSGEEQVAALKLWQDRVNMPVVGWVSGEPANTSAPRKGVVELRVVDLGAGRVQAGKMPHVNRGFEIAIRLLAKVLPGVC